MKNRLPWPEPRAGRRDGTPARDQAAPDGFPSGVGLYLGRLPCESPPKADERRTRRSRSQGQRMGRAPIVVAVPCRCAAPVGKGGPGPARKVPPALRLAPFGARPRVQGADSERPSRSGFPRCRFPLPINGSAIEIRIQVRVAPATAHGRLTRRAGATGRARRRDVAFPTVLPRGLRHSRWNGARVSPAGEAAAPADPPTPVP